MLIKLVELERLTEHELPCSFHLLSRHVLFFKKVFQAVFQVDLVKFSQQVKVELLLLKILLSLHRQ